MKIIKKTILFALAFLIFNGAAHALAAAGSTAVTMRLAKTEGSVYVRDKAEKPVPAKKDMRLYDGYTAGTEQKSYAWINLDDKKLFKLDAVSSAGVKKSGKELEVLLLSGKIFFNVSEPLKDDESLNIRTSTLVIGIRGTCGWVDIISEDEAKVSILEGRVEVTLEDLKTGHIKTMAVSAGESALCVSNGADGARIIKEDFKKDSIPGFVLTDIAEDKALVEKIFEKSDGKVDLRGVTEGQALSRLAYDEEQTALAYKKDSAAESTDAQPAAKTNKTQTSNASQNSGRTVGATYATSGTGGQSANSSTGSVYTSTDGTSYGSVYSNSGRSTEAMQDSGLVHTAPTLTTNPNAAATLQTTQPVNYLPPAAGSQGGSENTPAQEEKPPSQPSPVVPKAIVLLDSSGQPVPAHITTASPAVWELAKSALGLNGSQLLLSVYDITPTDPDAVSYPVTLKFPASGYAGAQVYHLGNTGVWQQFPTTYDGTYAITVTNSFSPFAVVVDKKGSGQVQSKPPAYTETNPGGANPPAGTGPTEDTNAGSTPETEGKHLVTFNFMDGRPNQTILVDDNAFAPRPEDPVRDKYDFAGWYMDSICHDDYMFSGGSGSGAYLINEPRTLYAKWTPKSEETSYQVIFDYVENYFGGSTMRDPYYVLSGDLAPPMPDPTFPGMVFEGWYTDTSYAPNTKWDIKTSTVTTNITLYAKWNATTYTVTYNYNYTGAPQPKTIEVPSGSLLPMDKNEQLKDPERTGYLFAGWFEDETFKTPVDYNNYTVIKPVTLYAKWTPDTGSKFKVTFNTNNKTNDAYYIYVSQGELVPSPAVPSPGPADTNLTNPTVEGWYTTPNFTYGTRWNFLQNQVTADVILYAKWKSVNEEKSIVQFDCGGYAPSYSINIPKGGLVPRQKDPVPYDSNMEFLGWYGQDYFRSEWNFDVGVSGFSTTLYAKWGKKAAPSSLESIEGAAAAPDASDLNSAQDTP